MLRRTAVEAPAGGGRRACTLCACAGTTAGLGLEKPRPASVCQAREAGPQGRSSERAEAHRLHRVGLGEGGRPDGQPAACPWGPPSRQHPEQRRETLLAAGAVESLDLGSLGHRAGGVCDLNMMWKGN